LDHPSPRPAKTLGPSKPCAADSPARPEHDRSRGRSWNDPRCGAAGRGAQQRRPARQGKCGRRSSPTVANETAEAHAGGVIATTAYGFLPRAQHRQRTADPTSGRPPPMRHHGHAFNRAGAKRRPVTGPDRWSVPFA
jgi:hypothetical protein